MSDGDHPFITADRLRATVGFADLIEPVARAFIQSSAGMAQNGIVHMHPAGSPEMGDVVVKTGVLAGHKVYVVKVAPWFAVNLAEQQPQGGFIAVFDSDTGHTRAILDEQHYLSDIRTAAAGALAARLFAPARVETAAVIGAGVQAYWQARALYGERRFARLVVWARDGATAARLRDRLASDLEGTAIELAKDAEQAVREADVVITATASRNPIVRGDWLHAGQHVTAVGADDPNKCELDAHALRRARVFVDQRDANAANGDIHRACLESRYNLNDITGEIGDVLAGRVLGRRAADEITIAKFIGIGAQDVAAAEWALSIL